MDAEGHEAINVFVYRHGERYAWPADSSRLPETDLGDLVESRALLKPGGNCVRSYLDVLAPDGTALEVLTSALADVAARLPSERNPTLICDRVTVRFGTETGLEVERGAEFRSLVRAIWPEMVLD